MTDRLKVGVVGVGTIGRLHAEAIRRIGADLFAFVGRTTERAQELAAEFNVPRAYDNIAILLDQRDVDVVHICTPNQYHFEMARDALVAGKHVICEKPLTLTPDESHQLVACAERAGLVNAVCFNTRFYPLVQEMRHHVATAQIGSAFSLRAEILEDSLLFATDYEWRLDPAQGGESNAMATIGCHLTDLVSHILGSPIVEVCAAFTTVHPFRRRSTNTTGPAEALDVPISSEDEARILVRFANGVLGTLNLSRAAAGRRYRIVVEVDGAKAALAWNSEMANQIWVGHRGRPNELILRDPDLLSDHARAYAGYIGAYSEAFADTMKQMIANVYGRIRPLVDRPSPRSDFATFADGHRAMLVQEAVLISAREQRWVSVATH
jgi:predicted dehydrogenase